MTVDEFLTELRLARADAPRGTRAKLLSTTMPDRAPWLRVTYPDNWLCDCPLTFLARSMGIEEKGGTAHDDGKALGLAYDDVMDVIDAADGHWAHVTLRQRMCEALGVPVAVERAA